MSKRYWMTILAGVMVLGLWNVEALARGRTYSPHQGRFLQRDPVGTPMAPPAMRNISEVRFTQPDPGAEYADGMNLYQYVQSNPVNRVDPLGLTSLINPCGYRVYRKEIDLSKLEKAKDPQIGNQNYEGYIGHTWIQSGNEIYDFPKGFQDSRHENPDWTWGTFKSLLGELQAGNGKGKSCACADCNDIKSCLQAMEDKYASCHYGDDGLGIFPPKNGKWNCRVHVQKSLSSCCLIQNLIPDKAFGVGFNQPIIQGN